MRVNVSGCLGTGLVLRIELLRTQDDPLAGGKRLKCAGLSPVVLFLIQGPAFGFKSKAGSNTIIVPCHSRVLSKAGEQG